MARLDLRRRRNTVSVSLAVAGRALETEIEAPVGRRRLDELLPGLRALDDRLVDAVVAEVEAGGERVSCAKGCAACCKAQPVPVTPPEAYALARLVARLPEPRRTAVRAAFAAAVERLAAAGLLDSYLDRAEPVSAEEARVVTRRYVDLRITCPFLVDDACSIYAERPFVCRQYLVTSDPALCVDPLANPVRPTPTPARFAVAMLRLGARRLDAPQHSLPLVLALAYVEAHRPELERTHESRELLADYLGELAQA
jgi:Fe-S-cluster containining protein